MFCNLTSAFRRAWKGGLVGILDKFNVDLERVSDNLFSRISKSEVEPVEIAARLQRELDSHAKLLSKGRRLVPNEFTVRLSPQDYERLAPYTKTLNGEIIPQLRDHATERRYVFNGPIRVDYDLDEELGIGRFEVDSGPRAQATHPSSGRLVLEANGVRHPLTPPGLFIGRGTEADLRLNDPGVSRMHARLHVWPTDDGVGVSIEDLGSTNGIIVDGVRVSTTELHDGSRIEVGSTRMLVHAPTGM